MDGEHFNFCNSLFAMLSGDLEGIENILHSAQTTASTAVDSVANIPAGGSSVRMIITLILMIAIVVMMSRERRRQAADTTPEKPSGGSPGGAGGNNGRDGPAGGVH